MSHKIVYFFGILLLFLGLFWLHSSDLIYHLNNDNHNEEDISLKFSLLGLIPTLIGLYLIEKYNRNLSKIDSNPTNSTEEGLATFPISELS